LTTQRIINRRRIQTAAHTLLEPLATGDITFRPFRPLRPALVLSDNKQGRITSACTNQVLGHTRVVGRVRSFYLVYQQAAFVRSDHACVGLVDWHAVLEPLHDGFRIARGWQTANLGALADKAGSGHWFPFEIVVEEGAFDDRPAAGY